MRSALCPFCMKPVSSNDVNSSTIGSTVIHDICIIKMRKWRNRYQQQTKQAEQVEDPFNE